MSEWKEAAEHNANSRIDWKEILGKSLNEFVHQQRAEGKQKNAIVANIMSIARTSKLQHSHNLDEVHDVIRIGVSARLAETGIAEGVKQNLGLVRGKVKKFADGKKYLAIVLPQEMQANEGDQVEVEIKRVLKG